MSAPGMQGPQRGHHRIPSASTPRTRHDSPARNPAPRGGPDHFFLFGRSASPLDHTGVAEPVNAPRNGLRPARSLMTEPALAGNAALDQPVEKKKQGTTRREQAPWHATSCKSIERGGYRYDVEETGDGARPYDVHQLHKAQGHWVDAGYGRYCASMAEADAYIGGQTA